MAITIVTDHFQRARAGRAPLPRLRWLVAGLVIASGCSPNSAGSTASSDPGGGQGGAESEPSEAPSAPPDSDEGARPSQPISPTPPPASRPTWGPPHHAALPLEPLAAGRYAYLPHRPKSHRVKGSGHTHSAPDHSGISAAAQQQRLRDLPDAHRHGFVWMTTHSFVAPDPGVSGIVHMYASEVYTAKHPESGQEPHVLAYLPNGDLSDTAARPFGYFKHDLATTSRMVREAGGVLAWAHPSRNPLSNGEIDAVDDLWGMEVVSGATDVVANLTFVDRRLGGGDYVCLTGGGDIHAEDYRLTRGYQVVEVNSEAPSREEIFEGVSSCNFFVCDAKNTTVAPLDPATLGVDGGALTFSSSRVAEVIRFVGMGGALLHEVSQTATASYVPSAQDRYVRVEVFADGGSAACYSQPVWLVDDEEIEVEPSVRP